jgi:hypothetical protein
MNNCFKTETKSKHVLIFKSHSPLMLNTICVDPKDNILLFTLFVIYLFEFIFFQYFWISLKTFLRFYEVF